MKVTLNTETGAMIISAIEITGNSINKIVRDAMTVYLEQLKQTDRYDHTIIKKTSSSPRSNQNKG